MHKFDWLRDLREIGDNTSRKVARELILRWIKSNILWKNASWKVQYLAPRLCNWMYLFDFYGNSADEVIKQYIFKSLTRQIRHLNYVLPFIQSPYWLLSSYKALLLFILTFEKNPLSNSFQEFLKIIERNIESQVLKDGCHTSRNPFLHLLMLRDLVDIKATLRLAQYPAPEKIQKSIEKMTPILRMFRHGDGTLSSLNESSKASSTFIDMVLSLADVKGRTPFYAGGFERIQAKNNLVLINTGPRLPLVEKKYRYSSI